MSIKFIIILDTLQIKKHKGQVIKFCAKNHDLVIRNNHSTLKLTSTINKMIVFTFVKMILICQKILCTV